MTKPCIAIAGIVSASIENGLSVIKATPCYLNKLVDGSKKNRLIFNILKSLFD